jgi:hypothetical protein
MPDMFHFSFSITKAVIKSKQQRERGMLDRFLGEKSKRFTSQSPV